MESGRHDQPEKAGPTHEAGWATATGSTKMRSAAVAAVAAGV